MAGESQESPKALAGRRTLTQARVVITDWKHDGNHHRRHSALGYQPTPRYAVTCTPRLRADDL
jgi:hypothetical protein